VVKSVHSCYILFDTIMQDIYGFIAIVIVKCCTIVLEKIRCIIDNRRHLTDWCAVQKSM
jgi:hypothetical protein